MAPPSFDQEALSHDESRYGMLRREVAALRQEVEEKEAEVNDTGGEIAQLQAKRKEVHLPAIQLISYCIHTRLHTGLHTTLITRKEGGGGERY